LLALLLACCTAPHPPPKPTEPALDLPPPPPPPPARPVLRAAWSFRSGPDACIALAKAGASNLQIAVRPEGLIRLSLSLPGDSPARSVAHFSGPAGHWLMPATHTGPHEVLFLLARNETSLSRVLILLSGGMLDLETPSFDLPILSLPESGAEGQEWFACARSSVSGT
jgi:hypothetical protein